MTGEIPPSLPPFQPGFGQQPLEEKILANVFSEKMDTVVDQLKELSLENTQKSSYLAKLSEEIRELYQIANEASKLGG